ncbi:hypothetical protein Ppb6_03462 [Photorhabdus australis subsp. thailandensis]|uniref:Uncharacterized protein n=1 Tax=Photorhabdus australis subsp. thailandensis TaxID=2805096 RepID=A0A1C0U0A2_9GAMM|nr:hypothetical protein Ppb6_03462 [Photorhabdus australis subsp. thailandensis]
MIETLNGRYGCGHIRFPANKSNRSKLVITVNPTNVINTKNLCKITLSLNQKYGAE